LKLRAQTLRMRSAEKRIQSRLEEIHKLSGSDDSPPPQRANISGLGLKFQTQEVEWLLYRGLERRVPVPKQPELDHLLACIAADQAAVQERLRNISDAAESQKLKRAVRDVFSSGGKRLRPALCLLVHQMLGQSEDDSMFRASTERPADEKVLRLATAIEIIHTASLVHDDILDGADTRRQQQTMHLIFGPDVAVLSGDFLFAHASGLIESLEDDEVTRLVSLVIEEFGVGELAQSGKRFDTSITLLDYLKKSFYKTASLLAASCRASAVLTGAPQGVCDAVYTYGFYLGIAFQIADDVLDFIASGDELGKPACQDLREGNLTAPVILCLQGDADLNLKPIPSAAELRRRIQRRFSMEKDLERATQLIHEGNGIEKAFQLAEKFSGKALEALALVAPNDSGARRALAGLTKWAVRRTS